MDLHGSEGPPTVKEFRAPFAFFVRLTALGVFVAADIILTTMGTFSFPRCFYYRDPVHPLLEWLVTAILLLSVALLVLVRTAFGQIGQLPRTGCRPGNPLANVRDPERLKLVRPCVAVRGVVTSVRQMGDGDCHVNLKLDPKANAAKWAKSGSAERRAGHGDSAGRSAGLHARSTGASAPQPAG
jgi:hypothetical protein